jgi:hypothetical protein
MLHPARRFPAHTPCPAATSSGTPTTLRHWQAKVLTKRRGAPHRGQQRPAAGAAGKGAPEYTARTRRLGNGRRDVPATSAAPQRRSMDSGVGVPAVLSCFERFLPMALPPTRGATVLDKLAHVNALVSRYSTPPPSRRPRPCARWSWAALCADAPAACYAPPRTTRANPESRGERVAEELMRGFGPPCPKRR